MVSLKKKKIKGHTYWYAVEMARVDGKPKQIWQKYLDFFVNFSDYFDHPARTDLTVNYRSVKSIVDTGAEIIKQNGSSQLKKKTSANDKSVIPVKVYSFEQQSTHKSNLTFKDVVKNIIKQPNQCITYQNINSLAIDLPTFP